MGIDGRIFPVCALDNRRKNKSDELNLEEKFFAIQAVTQASTVSCACVTRETASPASGSR